MVVYSRGVLAGGADRGNPPLVFCRGEACALAIESDADVIAAVEVCVGWVPTIAEVHRVAVASGDEGHYGILPRVTSKLK